MQSDRFFYTDYVGDGKKRHRHILYVNDATGVAGCSNSIGYGVVHNHDIAKDPEFGWQVYPAEDHVHSILPFEVPNKTSKQSDSDIIAETLSLWSKAQVCEETSKKKAEESDKFYTGEHWDSEQKRRMEQQNRAALTINRTQRNVNEMSGLLRQQRTDIVYVPVEDTDQAVADILTIVVKRILSACNYWMEENEATLDQIIRGRGNLSIGVSFDNDLRGDIIVQAVPDVNVCYGPHRKVDGSDAEYVCIDEWYSLGKLKQLFPDKAKDIELDFSAYTNRDEGPEVEVPIVTGDKELVNIARKQYRVIECRRKSYTKVPILVNADDDFYFNALNWSAKDIAAVKTIPGFYVVDRIVGKIRVTKIAGGVVLSDEDPADLPIDNFFIIPIYCSKRGNEYWGIIEIGKDPQAMMNKFYSIAVDIANKMSSYFWWYTDNSFLDASDRQKFVDNANTPGAVIKCSDLNSRPIKEETGTFPADMVNMLNTCTNLLAELMDVHVDSAGANESASHLLQRQQARLTGSEHVFDNLTLAKTQLGRLLLPYIQKYYDAERIYRILVDESTKNQVLINGQPLDDYPIEVIQKLLTDTDITKLDVDVTEEAFSPTTRMATFMVMQELAQKGQAIPPDLLLELAPIPQRLKSRALQAMQQQSEAAGAEADAQKQMEENKTLIAPGIMPPAVQERLNQEQQAMQQQQMEAMQGNTGLPEQEQLPIE